MTFGLIRKRLTEREGAPPDTRYTEDGDMVETSVDGGLTWTPNPGADPRKNPAYQLPPNEESDPRCAAAAGMTAYIRQFVDAGIVGTTALGIANGVLGIALVFIPVSWFFALMLAVGTALFELGAAALALSFTEDIYNQIQCIFYANIDADGILSEAGLTNVYAEIDAIGDITVSAAFSLAVQPMGNVGMTNAGVKLADGEAECACGWCYVWFGSNNDGDFTPYVLSGTAGNYAGGFGWEAVSVSSWGGHDRVLLMGRFIFPEPLTCSSIDMHYDWVVGTSSGLTEGLGVYVNDFATNLHSVDQNLMTTGDDQTVNINTGIPEGIASLDFWLQPAIDDFSGAALMTVVQMRGTGEPPTFLEGMGWVAC